MQTQLRNIESQRRTNNDPLAHIDIILNTYNGSLAEHRIHTEFVTDMGERLRQPFSYNFIYHVKNNNLISDTGMSLTGLLEDGYEAAKQDVSNHTQVQYHADRAQALMEQQSLIMQWYQSEDQNNLLLASLCPPDSELAVAESKKQAFKPDRSMASIQLFRKLEDGSIEMQAFSIDNLDLPGLRATVSSLGGLGEIADNTLDQLLRPIILNKSIDAKKFIETNDQRMLLSTPGSTSFVQGMDVAKYKTEANTFVESRPETWDLYISTVKEVALSLKEGVVSSGLTNICKDHLAPAFVASSQRIPDFLSVSLGDTYSEDMARGLMKYLINQAIPEYLISKIEIPVDGSLENMDSGSYGIAEAGVSAVQSGNTHEGSCPTSTPVNSTITTALGTEKKILSQVYNSVQLKPKAIISRGDYEMLPIGSCPVCKSECGTGIRSKSSGSWYCTQGSCKAFNKEIYDYVLGRNRKVRSPNQKDDQQTRNSSKPEDNKDYLKHILNIELSLLQQQISQLTEKRYTAGLSQSERTHIINMLIEKDLRKKVLLRASLGDLASIDALGLELAA